MLFAVFSSLGGSNGTPIKSDTKELSFTYAEHSREVKQEKKNFGFVALFTILNNNE